MTFFSTISGIKIIPVHMNCIFMNPFFSFHSNLNKERFKTIIKELNDEMYIFDFANIKNTMISDTIEYFAGELLPRNFMLVNLEPIIHDRLLNHFNNKLLDYKTGIVENCLRTEGFSSQYNDISELKDFGYLINHLKKKIQDNIEGPGLTSSNVYSSKLFNMRKLFIDVITVKAAVYLMAIKLYELERELEEENKIDKLGYKLISSSFNGCILANLLALVMKKKHISIPYLGPEIADEDNRYRKYLKRNDKFVYIYDFISLGNEQKTIAVVTKLLRAEVFCALGITYYRESKKYYDDTRSLINFEDIIKHVIITGEEEDLHNLMRYNKND